MKKLMAQHLNTLRNIACAIGVIGICATYSQKTYCQEEYGAPSSPSPGAHSQLQLMGVWSFVATTHGLAPDDPESYVQRGHWAIVHDGNPYLTAYVFEKTRPSGRKFHVTVHAKDGQLAAEMVDIEDNFRKRQGISRVSNDGATIELAFNFPPDGSDGPAPTSFDSKSEPKGFVLIVLNRLSDQPDLEHAIGQTRPQVLNR